MYITAGNLKGFKVRVPANTRPTTSKTREALFSIIGPEIYNSTFGDFFAGSGVVGIEALSRGAKKVAFVDSSLKFLDNIRKLTPSYKEKITYVKCKLPHIPEILKKLKMDFVFMDPPYNSSRKNIYFTIEKIHKNINKLLILEIPKLEESYYSSPFAKKYIYGDSVLLVIKAYKLSRYLEEKRGILVRT